MISAASRDVCIGVQSPPLCAGQISLSLSKIAFPDYVPKYTYMIRP